MQALRSGDPETLKGALWPMTGRLDTELEALTGVLVPLYMAMRELAGKKALPARKTFLRGAADDDPYKESRAWAEAYVGRLIGMITEDAREAIRLLVSRAFLEGIPPADLAHLIISQELVGLSSQQTKWVLDFRDAILARKGKWIKLADGSKVDVPIDVAPEKVESWVKQYADKLLAARANTIARTETIAAANAGQSALWNDAVKDGWLKPAQKRRWVAAPGCCKVCGSELHNQVVGLNQGFVCKYGVIMNPPAHPNCRCAVVLAIGPAPPPVVQSDE